jgi:hypothetical protein
MLRVPASICISAHAVYSCACALRRAGYRIITIPCGYREHQVAAHSSTQAAAERKMHSNEPEVVAWANAEARREES